MKHLHNMDLHHPSGKFSNLTYLPIKRDLKKQQGMSDFKKIY